MHLRHILPSCFLFLCPQLSWALQIHTIDEYHPRKAQFSVSSFNRIVVERGGIKKVIAPEGAFEVEIDELTHQAFITFVRPLEEPTAISIITNAGYVQDLIIEGSKSPTETLLLKQPSKEEEILDQSPQDLIPHVLSAFARDLLPYGYVEEPVCSTDQRKENHPTLTLKPTRAFEGPYERIVVYEVIHTATVKMPLTEQMLQETDDLWMHIESPFIEPNQTQTLIIAKKRVQP